MVAPDDDAAPVPTRPASTVMLIRDPQSAASGVEVFVLRRTAGAAFAGGFYVFPGGVVDAADRVADLESISTGLDDVSASAALGVESGGLAYWVAAIRECFEESGILLAHRPDGAAPLHDAPTWDDDRRALHAGSLPLIDICRRDALTLDVGDLRYVAHWVTPVAERPRRFDTRFFLAAAPSGQEGAHDDAETVSSMWVHPDEALERSRRGELMLLPPTVACLQELAEATDVGDALQRADAAGPPPLIMPTMQVDDAGNVTGVRLDDGRHFPLSGPPQ